MSCLLLSQITQMFNRDIPQISLSRIIIQINIDDIKGLSYNVKININKGGMSYKFTTK